MRIALFVMLTLAASAASAEAQTVPEDRPGLRAAVPESSPPSIAERLALPSSAAPLLVTSPAILSTDGTELLPVQTTGRGTALAIVGGALFVGGLIAGGDAGTLMVIAGAGIGAYGLYLMLTP